MFHKKKIYVRSYECSTDCPKKKIRFLEFCNAARDLYHAGLYGSQQRRTAFTAMGCYKLQQQQQYSSVAVLVHYYNTLNAVPHYTSNLITLNPPTVTKTLIKCAGGDVAQMPKLTYGCKMKGTFHMVITLNCVRHLFPRFIKSTAQLTPPARTYKAPVLYFSILFLCCPFFLVTFVS